MPKGDSKHLVVLGNDVWAIQGGQALEDLGHIVTYLPISNGDFDLNSTINTIKSVSAEFCLTRNMYLFNSLDPKADELYHFLLKSHIPIVSWFQDNPISTQGTSRVNGFDSNEARNNHVFFCTDKSFVPFFQDRGFKSFYLPHCANKKLQNLKIDQASQSQYTSDLTFVGTCPKSQFFADQFPLTKDDIFQYTVMILMTDLGMEAGLGSLDDKNNPCLPIYKKIFEYLSDFLREDYWISSQYQNEKNNLSSRLGSLLNRDHIFCLNKIDFFYSFYQLIVSLLSLTSLGIKIYGGDEWSRFFGSYQKSYPRIEYFTEIPKLFHDSKINFCLTKWQYQGAVHDRPLTIWASGGFALTDYRSDMEHMFETGDIVYYRSLDEAKDLIQFYLKHESDRLKVIDKARSRVFERHTYHHRMQDLINTLTKEGIL